MGCALARRARDAQPCLGCVAVCVCFWLRGAAVAWHPADDDEYEVPVVAKEVPVSKPDEEEEEEAPKARAHARTRAAKPRPPLARTRAPSLLRTHAAA
jgi:hypothetical protein